MNTRRMTSTDERRVSGLNSALGERRVHLAALDAVISQSGEPLSCGVVRRAGGPLVLFVVLGSDRLRTVDVGCDRVGGVWWFVRADSGEGLVPVDEVEKAPGLLAGLLSRPAAG